MTEDKVGESLFFIFSASLMIIVCILISISVGRGNYIHKLKQEAIDKNYAIYNPTNGVWQWK